MPETFAHTALGSLATGDSVNLEPSLRVGDPMGGHWVQGHVDAVGTVRSRREHGNALDLEIETPPEVLRYCVERGSIAVQGTSLTLMHVGDDFVRVSLIPETRARTTLGALHPGDPVNLEADVLAKYVERLLAQAHRQA